MTRVTRAPEDADPRLGSRRIRRVVYDREAIRGRVRELGREISEAYADVDDLLVLGLLKGSFVFLADLVREITRPLRLDFVIAASYGSGTESSGRVRVLYDPEVALKGRTVLVVEDIVDSGTTLNWLLPHLRGRGPVSVDLCALLHKRLAEDAPDARWVGFDAPNEFLVGYGLDHAEDFRHLPYIASL